MTRIPVGLVLVAGALLASCASFGRRLTIAYEAVFDQLTPNTLEIRLDRAFVERYRNRLTIDATMTVDVSAESPNPAIFDGDLHFAGRAPEIGLRLVGEIINAGRQDSAVARVRRAQGGLPLRMTGVWRLWPEHAVGRTQEQGQPVAPLRNANPEHVFELHPITRLDGLRLLDAFIPVDGYLPGDPVRTFGIYREARYALRVEPSRLFLTVRSGLYNDVHFQLRPTGEGHTVVGDGRFVTADALDLEGNLLAPRIRTAFVRGTAPERALRALEPGGRLHVWGLPRISFAALSQLARAADRAAAPLEGPLPYEIVVLGVYPPTGGPR